MKHNALRRAVGAVVVLAATASLLGHGIVGSTFALFNGETTNAGSQFAVGWIPIPTAMKAAQSGYTITPSWTPGAGTPTVTTQKVYYFDAGATSTCPDVGSASYTLLSTFNNNTTATYTDTNRASGHNGDYYCYEVTDGSSTYTTWTSGATVRTSGGMALTGVSLGTGDGIIENNDTIVLTWSQRTTLTTSTTTNVCVYANGTVLIGDSNANCGTSSDTYSVAKLTGATSIAALHSFKTSTEVSTTTAPFTTTITLKNGANEAVSPASPTWTATPSTSITSNTGGIAACATGANCTPTTTTNF
jgi:hypothetical protein